VIKIKKYTIEQISNEEEISQKKIRKHIAAGLLEAEKKSNKWEITENALEEWLNEGKSLDSKAKEWLQENYVENNSEQLALFNKEVKVEKEKNNRDNGDNVNWTDISKRWNDEKDNGYNYIELFAGAGGLSLGYEMAGFEGLLANEVMEKAVETYKHNFNHPIIDGDIREQETKNKIYEAVKGKDIDLISGGFPCKGFSLSGYRIVTDERNNLYKEMLEIVKNIKPKFVVMENVVGLRSMLEGKVEEMILKDFKDIGYDMNVTVLNSADYYVPQVRKRVIFIGNRIGHKNYHPQPLLDESEYLTIKDAIEDLIDHPKDKDFNHVQTRHGKDMKERIAAVEEGDGLYDNYSDAWKKSPWNEPSCTVKENHGGVNLHPRLPRVITAREMARLQSFPDEFIFKGAKKWQLKQIGNAVPPLLGKAIGLAVEKSLDG